MISGDISKYIPQLRPHNVLRDQKIFFMISSRPTVELSPKEMLLYDNIDGARTVAELEQMHAGATSPLLKWHEARIVELIPPIPSPARPHLVVIEPHMDDAVLSAGGRLLHRRRRSRITILSVVKWSNFTSYLLLKRNFFNLQDVTDLRLEESDLVAKLLGAEHQCLDWSDAPIRFWPAERWSAATLERFKSNAPAFVKLYPSPKDTSLLAEQLAQALDSLTPDELWIPMGLGDHIDHRTTRSACLRLLADSRYRFAGLPVSMYEDLPYAANEGHAAQIRRAFGDCGNRLGRASEDITDVFEEKLRVVSVYASQFKSSYMDPMLRKFAEAEAGVPGKFSEAYYRVERLRSVPRECFLSRESEGLKKLQDDARVLMRRSNRLRKLTILALPTGQLGRWETVRESLLREFPNAKFRICASEDLAWQMEGNSHGLFRLKVLRRGGLRYLGWLSVLFRELLFGTSTIVLWRGAYASEPMRAPKKLVNILIKSLLPFRRVLFARSLWDFCCALEAQTDGSEPEKRIADIEMVHV